MTIHSVLVPRDKNKVFVIPIQITSESQNQTVDTEAMLDTGAGGKFIDQNFSRKLDLPRFKLKEPIRVKNVDGTLNKTGTVTHYVKLDLTIKGRTRMHKLLITGLGKETIILGLPWFTEENPEINWQTQELNWRTDPDLNPDTLETPTEGYPLQINSAMVTEDDTPDDIWINAKTTASQTLAQEDNTAKSELALTDLIPQEHQLLAG